ncbi:phage tail protein [Haloferula chungangensis]|uniref:Phage tail protein n=1 Tax=Haloferula chungangensis TaxID=1048331 RepID=A0ABW2L278_9BACT
MNSPKSTLGHDLYQILPAVYRERDGGDLAKYLDTCGELLDQFQATLQQRLADQFPDNPESGPACQDWLLPYFADLLDVRLHSPLPDGQRDEISNAISWRQRKGTLAVIEQVVEAISQAEAVIHEGWQRVAMTPRIGKPLLSATVHGYDDDAPEELINRHPDLPAVTIDFRHPSGAVKADSDGPGIQNSNIEGIPRRWRQASRHGTPCHQGSYEDHSRRSVDFRSSNWRTGHFHPRKLLLYTAPPAGFFPENMEAVLWTDRDNEDGRFQQWIERIEQEDGRVIYRNRTWGTDDFVPVRIRRTVELDTHESGHELLWRFEGIVFENTLLVHHGRVELLDCAARKVELHGIEFDRPILSARNCLFKSIQAARGLCRLEYCTVLADALIEIPQASDCIFLEAIDRHHRDDTPPQRGCIRYSRIAADQESEGMRLIRNTRDHPEFFSERFGERGAGVLHPAVAESISHGAEDGWEMGAFHDFHHCRIRTATVEKLKDYLPIGYQAVLIPDERLPDAPEKSISQ